MSENLGGGLTSFHTQRARTHKPKKNTDNELVKEVQLIHGKPATVRGTISVSWTKTPTQVAHETLEVLNFRTDP
jgi:hypothetical protein